MVKPSLRPSLLALLATVAGSLLFAPSSFSATHRERRARKVEVNLQDTGKTVPLAVGQDLVITLPLRRYNDNYWYVARNSGAPLRLIAGPNEIIRPNVKPWTRRTLQVFYFRREDPGTNSLVLEQNYWSKPMILKVVDVASSPPPPPPPPSPPPPPPAPIKQKLVLRGVHFDFNRTNIRPGDTAVLDEAVTALKQNPDVVVDINGYCDSIGDVDYNQRLSEYRGNAVANYLLDNGILATQMRVNGYGKTGFVATNRTAEGRAQNRRVELVPE